MKRKSVPALALALTTLLMLTSSLFPLFAQNEVMDMPPDTENIPLEKEYARSYKIHIATFTKSSDKDWLIRNAKIDKLQDLGQIYWEAPYQGVVRVYLGNFSGKKTVEKILTKVQDRGYDAAKVVVYDKSHYSIVLWEEGSKKEAKIVSVYQGNGKMTPVELTPSFATKKALKTQKITPTPSRGAFAPPPTITSRNPIILDVRKPKGEPEIWTKNKDIGNYDDEEEIFMEWQVIDEEKIIERPAKKEVVASKNNQPKATVGANVTNKWLANNENIASNLTTSFGDATDLNLEKKTFYVVQIGAFSKKRSLKTNTFLPLKNIAAVYTEDTPDYNKVILGPFSDKTAAKTAMKTVKSYNYDAFMRPVQMTVTKDITMQMQLLGMEKLF
ncbi:MAG: SPOR domain-containing protein [Chitinophagales bacterium]